MARRKSTTLDRPEHDLERALLMYAGRIQHHIQATALEFDMSAQQAFALRLLDSSTSMSDLAGGMHCDPSNVTGIIDRLEARGFVERREDPADRRVRLLVVTDAGREQRDRIERRLLDAIPGAGRLTVIERGRLLELLAVAFTG